MMCMIASSSKQVVEALDEVLTMMLSSTCCWWAVPARWTAIIISEGLECYLRSFFFLLHADSLVRQHPSP
jgi:hypothetical protein